MFCAQGQSDHMVIIWESYGDPMVRVRQGTVSESETTRKTSVTLTPL